jgi:lipopolysaccharide heptosyltransferase II
MQGNESLLIILMGALGDLVRGLCLPAMIKAQYPNTHISWLVEPRWHDLVRHHDLIDNVLVFDRPRGIRALSPLRRKLRQHPFDITVDLQRHFKSGLFSLFSGSPQRIGFHPRNAKEFNWLFNNVHIPYFSEKRSKLQHYLQFAAALGVYAKEPLNFGLAALADAKIAPNPARFLRRPYIVVVMGSSWPSKNWHADGYRRLLVHVLQNMPVGVALVGDDSQRILAQNVTAGITTNRLVDLTGRTTLPELTALLGQAAAGVGPDSGPGHLAAAVGTPYVTLFGPTPPGRVAPIGCEDLVVVANTDCTVCFRKHCLFKEHTCMRAITPEMVARQLEMSLRRHPVRRGRQRNLAPPHLMPRN